MAAKLCGPKGNITRCGRVTHFRDGLIIRILLVNHTLTKRLYIMKQTFLRSGNILALAVFGQGYIGVSSTALIKEILCTRGKTLRLSQKDTT